MNSSHVGRNDSQASQYTDQHVPNAITKGLRLRGIDVLRVQDDGHDRALDHVILDRAVTLGRVVFYAGRRLLGYCPSPTNSRDRL